MTVFSPPFTASYARGLAHDLAEAASRYRRQAACARTAGRRRNFARQAAILSRAARRWSKVAATAKALS